MSSRSARRGGGLTNRKNVQESKRRKSEREKKKKKKKKKRRSGTKKEAGADVVYEDDGSAHSARSREEDAGAIDVSDNITDNGLVDRVKRVLQNRYENKSSLRKIFRLWDANKDGSIDCREMHDMFGLLGLPDITETQSAQIHKMCDPDGNGSIKYKEFLDMVFESNNLRTGDEEEEEKSTLGGEDSLVDKKRLSGEVTSTKDSDDWGEEDDLCSPDLLREVVKVIRSRYKAKRSLRKVFQLWDKNRDGNISREEMFEIFGLLGLSHLSKKQVGGVHRACDPDRSGMLDYTEFVNVVFNPRFEGDVAIKRRSMLASKEEAPTNNEKDATEETDDDGDDDDDDDAHSVTKLGAAASVVPETFSYRSLLRAGVVVTSPIRRKIPLPRHLSRSEPNVLKSKVRRAPNTVPTVKGNAPNSRKKTSIRDTTKESSRSKTRTRSSFGHKLVPMPKDMILPETKNCSDGYFSNLARARDVEAFRKFDRDHGNRPMTSRLRRQFWVQHVLRDNSAPLRLAQITQGIFPPKNRDRTNANESTTGFRGRLAARENSVASILAHSRPHSSRSSFCDPPLSKERVAECLSDLSEDEFRGAFRKLKLRAKVSALKSSKKAHRAIFHVDDPNAYKTWKTEMTSIRSRKEANERKILEETRRVAAERRRRTDKYAAFLRKHNAHLW